jgi:hypothetical protein
MIEFVREGREKILPFVVKFVAFLPPQKKGGIPLEAI